MAWTEDRWIVRVANDDGSKTDVHSSRYGYGLRWRVRYETADGAERSRSFARKPDADRFRTETEADLMRGTYRDPDAGKITLQRYAGQWLENQTFDDSSRENIGYRIEHVNAGLGGKRLDQVTPSMVNAWMRGLRLAPSTKRQCLTALSSIFAAAVDDGRVAVNPCRARSVKAPKADRHEVVPLEEAHLAGLRDGFPARYRAMVDAGAECGLRQGEIFGLSVDEIDFLHRAVHVVRQVKIVGGRMVFAAPKGRKKRDVPLPRLTAETFAEHVRKFPPVPVTLPCHAPGTRQHGKPVTVRLIFTSPVARMAVSRHRFNTNVWKPALKAAGIPATRENGMHVLRHSYASALLHRGVDIKRVAKCLGHDDPGFTLRTYTHLMEGGDEQVRQAIDAGATVPSPAPALREVR
jgi:integrase